MAEQQERSSDVPGRTPKKSKRAAPAEAEAARPDVRAVVRKALQVHSKGFWCFAIAILLVAGFTRLWDLGSRPYHHDESIHANSSWGLATGSGYRFDPVYHGPFLYNLTAMTFKLFGDSDYTGRLTPALFGIGLVAMILFALPRWIGRRGAIMAAILVTVSPAMVCYQRYLIHDSYMLVFTLTMIVCYLRLHEGGSPAFIYPFALAASLAICTKANSYFILFIIASFDYVAAFVRCVIAVQRAERVPRLLSWLAVVAVGLFVGAGVNVLMLVRSSEALPIAVSASAALVLWGLSRALLSLLRHTLVEPGKPSFLSENWLFMLEGTVLALVVYSALYTNGFRFREGFVEGVYKTFSYWGGQQQHPRLPGPLTYHFVLLALYELPTAIAGILGVVWALARPSSARVFIVYWGVISLALYSAANEKVPWLIVHPLLPLAILAGGMLGAGFDALGRRIGEARAENRKDRVGLLHAVSAFLLLYVLGGTLLLARGSYALLGPNHADSHEPMLYMQAPDELVDTLRRLDPGLPPEGKTNIVIDGDAEWPLFWYMRGRRGVTWDRMKPTKDLQLVILNRSDAEFDAGHHYRWREVKLRGWMLFSPSDMSKKQPLLNKLRSEMAELDFSKMVAFVLYREPMKEPGWTTVTFHYRDYLQQRLEGQPDVVR